MNTMAEEIIELSKSGYAIEDIAEELGISEDSVWNTLIEAGILW